jgi:hypothetical protein
LKLYRKFFPEIMKAESSNADEYVLLVTVWTAAFGRVKVVYTHADKGTLENGGVVPLIINVDTRWIAEVRFWPRPLCVQREVSQCQLNGRLWRSQSRPGQFGKDVILMSMLGIEMNFLFFSP